jgi:hypothetical protein
MFANFLAKKVYLLMIFVISSFYYSLPTVEFLGYSGECNRVGRLNRDVSCGPIAVCGVTTHSETRYVGTKKFRVNFISLVHQFYKAPLAIV